MSDYVKIKQVSGDKVVGYVSKTLWESIQKIQEEANASLAFTLILSNPDSDEERTGMRCTAGRGIKYKKV